MKLTTPPLAPKVVQTLATLQIHTTEDVQAACPCHAFLLLKQTGLTVTQSVFWQLVAISLHKTVADLSAPEKQYWQQKLQQTPPVAIFPTQAEMERLMHAALVQAALAAECGEVPVGAVVVHRGEIIAQAHNRCIADCDIGRHAEMNALARRWAIIVWRIAMCMCR